MEMREKLINNYSNNENFDFTGEMFIRFALREQCPYLEFLWSAFFRIRIEYGDLRNKFNPNAGKCGSEKLRIRTLFAQSCK